MTENLIYKRIQEFANREPVNITRDKFLELLKKSSRSKKMSIAWRTADESVDGTPLDAHMSYHLMWWDANAFSNSNAGGSQTKASNNQLNLKVTPGFKNWRTLSYANIESVLFLNVKYKIVG